ncbi:MAG: cyclase family protein [Gemmatimonadaceae bacterium]
MTRPIHDISIAFAPGTPEWPGDTPCACGWSWAIAQGASVNVSRMETSPHVGTHADAPLHVAVDAPGANQLPLDAFIGLSRVIDVRHLGGEITMGQLEAAGYLSGTTRLLLHTGRTIANGTFPEGWPVLAPAAARALVADGLRLLGVDCPSVDARESQTLEVHRILFDGGANVLENLDLRAIRPGPYELLAPPLAVGAIDAAPVRALLRPL